MHRFVPRHMRYRLVITVITVTSPGRQVNIPQCQFNFKCGENQTYPLRSLGAAVSPRERMCNSGGARAFEILP